MAISEKPLGRNKAGKMPLVERVSSTDSNPGEHPDCDSLTTTNPEPLLDPVGIVSTEPGGLPRSASAASQRSVVSYDSSSATDRKSTPSGTSSKLNINNPTDTHTLPVLDLSLLDLTQYPPIAALRIETNQLVKEMARFRPCDEETMSCFYCREWVQWVYRKTVANRSSGGTSASVHETTPTLNTPASSWLPPHLEQAVQTKKTRRPQVKKGNTASAPDIPLAKLSVPPELDRIRKQITSVTTAPPDPGFGTDPRQAVPTVELLIEHLTTLVNTQLTPSEDQASPADRKQPPGVTLPLTSDDNKGKQKGKTKGRQKSLGSGTRLSKEDPLGSAKPSDSGSITTNDTAQEAPLECSTLVALIIERVATWYSALSFPLEGEYGEISFDQAIKAFPIEDTEDPHDPALLLPALQVSRSQISLASDNFSLLNRISSELLSTHAYPACDHNSDDHPLPSELETRRIIYNEQIVKPRGECRQSFYGEMNPVWQITYLLIRSVQRIEAMRVRLLEKGCVATHGAFLRAHTSQLVTFPTYWANALGGPSGGGSNSGKRINKKKGAQPVKRTKTLTEDYVDSLFKKYLDNIREISESWCHTFMDNYFSVARDFVAEFESILRECVDMCHKRLLSLRNFPRSSASPSPKHEPAEPSQSSPTADPSVSPEAMATPHPDDPLSLDAEETTTVTPSGFVIRDLNVVHRRALEAISRLQPRLERNITHIMATLRQRNQEILTELDAIWETWKNDAGQTVASRLDLAAKKDLRQRLRTIVANQHTDILGWTIAMMETLLSAKDVATVCVECLAFVMAEAQQLEKAVLQAFVQKWSPTTTHYNLERQDILDDFTEGLLTGREELAGIAGKLFLKEAWRILETNISRERQRVLFSESKPEKIANRPSASSKSSGAVPGSTSTAKPKKSKAKAKTKSKMTATTTSAAKEPVNGSTSASKGLSIPPELSKSIPTTPKARPTPSKVNKASTASKTFTHLSPSSVKLQGEGETNSVSLSPAAVSSACPSSPFTSVPTDITANPPPPRNLPGFSPSTSSVSVAPLPLLTTDHLSLAPFNGTTSHFTPTTAEFPSQVTSQIPTASSDTLDSAPLSVTPDVLDSIKTQIGQWSREQLQDALLALIPERVQLTKRLHEMEHQLVLQQNQQRHLLQGFHEAEARLQYQQQQYEWQLRQLRLLSLSPAPSTPNSTGYRTLAGNNDVLHNNESSALAHPIPQTMAPHGNDTALTAKIELDNGSSPPYQALTPNSNPM
ncbi:hypothetical protein IWQ61_000043 [Dispira simplex]|nr:hypothetical protein IWQ61_000043 [Dispira simplex]